MEDETNILTWRGVEEIMNENALRNSMKPNSQLKWKGEEEIITAR